MIVYVVSYYNANDDYHRYIWGVFDTNFLANAQKLLIKTLNEHHCGFRVESFRVMSKN